MLHELLRKLACPDEAKQNGTADSVSMDGTWQKRGFSSLNGVAVAVSTSNFKVLDVEIMSRNCKACSLKEELLKQTRSSMTNGRPPMNQAATSTKKDRQEIWRWLVM